VLAGRPEEVSNLRMSNLCTLKYVTSLRSSCIIDVDLYRAKGNGDHKVPIFPQADKEKWWEDTYFLIALSLMYRSWVSGLNILSITDPLDQPIMPAYYRTETIDTKTDSATDAPTGSWADYDNENKATKDSSVSKFWKNTFKKVLGFLDELSEEQKKGNARNNNQHWWRLNSSLTAYNGRKRLPQELVDRGTNPVAIIYHVGWESRSMHTLFEYTIRTKALTLQAAYAIAGWVALDNNGNPTGGLPPTTAHAYSDISDDTSKADIILKTTSLRNRFFLSAISREGKPGVTDSVLDLLMGSVLKHWKALTISMEDRPADSEGCTKANWTHNMLTAFLRSRNDGVPEITPDEFNVWCESTVRRFEGDNMFALPISSIDQLPAGVAIDGRPLLEHFTNSREGFKILQDQQIVAHARMVNLETRVGNIETTLSAHTKLLQDILGILTNGNAAVNSSVVDADATPGNILIPFSQPASISNIATHSNGTSMSYCFWWEKIMPRGDPFPPSLLYIFFFLHGLEDGWQQDLKDRVIYEAKILADSTSDLAAGLKKKFKTYKTRMSGNYGKHSRPYNLICDILHEKFDQDHDLFQMPITDDISWSQNASKIIDETLNAHRLVTHPEVKKPYTITYLGGMWATQNKNKKKKLP